MAEQMMARPPSGSLQLASLYVGDLDPQVTEMDLEEAFGQMGSLVSVRLCKDRLSHQSLRYGYVNFSFPSDASKALACLNHTELRGKPMRIMWRQSDPHIRKTGVGNVFVKNLDPSITSARLQVIFCKFGTVLSCKVAQEHGKSKGFGFVQFDSEDSSMASVNALHGTMLEGKKLYVSKFIKRSDRDNGNEEPKFTNLYVKNLREFVTEDILLEKFSEHGKVRNVLIMKDAEGKSKGFGFVNFESYKEAKKAVEALNGALLGLKKLFVGRALKKAEREELLQREYNKITDSNFQNLKFSNLYVRNLSSSIDDRQLEEHFSSFGKVTSAKVMCHDSGISKRFGFVSFSTPEEGKKALNALHGTDFKKRDLYVAVAQSKEERQRIMQNYYAHYPPQTFYSSNSQIFTPLFAQTYGSFPPPPPNQTMHPFMTRGYSRDECAYIPTRQYQQQGTYMDFVYKHPMGYPDSISKDKRSGAEQVSSKGYMGTKSLNSVPYIGNCKQDIGHAVEKTGVVLERKKSDAHKTLNSSNSLAMHGGKGVQVLEDVNSWTSGGDCLARKPKSAHFLNY